MSEEIRVNRVPRDAREFQGLRAGIVSRTIANSIDFLVVVLMVSIVYLAWTALRLLINPVSFTFPRPAPVLVLGFFGATLAIYFWLCWASTGRTAGNKLMGLRVVGYSGKLMRWSGALMRALFCVGFPIGLFWAAISNENRSVQDLVLRSSCIYDWGRGRIHLGREANNSPKREEQEAQGSGVKA